MSGRSRRLPIEEAQDLLTGRLPVRMEDLFDLIHRVNPTGQEWAGHEQAQAYALKSALQSLLVERFGEMLALEEVEGTGGAVVGLRHRTYAKDACHAIVAELSPLAHSWVRLQRDLPRPEQPPAAARPAAPAPPPGEPAGPAGLVALGEAALMRFDYDGAATLFGRALEWPEPWLGAAARVRAARALLELLVDTLADDAGALRLQERLPPEPAADELVRCLLALAAARRGDAALAGRLIAGIEHERAHEVLLELSRRALAAGDVRQCEEHLARIPAGSAHLGPARALEGEAGRLRAERARPLEQELASLLERGDLAGAGALAREVLFLHPGSEPARRVMAELRAAEQQDSAASLAAAVEKALLARDPEQAGLVLRRLELLAGPRPDLQRQLESVAAAWAREREQQQIEALLLELHGELLPRAVEAFWEAPGPVRQACRNLIDRPEVAWLEELGPVRGNAARAAAGAAAAALPRAEQELLAGRVEAAEQILAPHAELLLPSPRGSELWARARALAAAERQRLALERLATAEAAAAQDRRLALQRLGAIRRADLDEAGRTRAAALEERLLLAEHRAGSRRRDLRLLAAAAAVAVALAGLGILLRTGMAHRSPEEIALEEAERAGHLYAARAAAERLAAGSSDEAERAAWQARRDEANRKLRARYIVAEAVGPEIAGQLGEVPWSSELAGPFVWVAAQGDAVATAQQFGRYVYVRAVHHDAPRSRACVLRMEEGFHLDTVHVEDRALMLLSSVGGLDLDLDTFDPIKGRFYAVQVPGGRVTKSTLAPGRRHIWLDWAVSGEGGLPLVGGRPTARATSVIRRDGSGAELELTGCSKVLPIWGLPAPAVLASATESDFALFEDSGTRLWSGAGTWQLAAAVVHPDGNSLLVLKSAPGAAAQGGGFQLTAETWSVAGERRHVQPLATMPRPRVVQAATSLALGCTFVLAQEDDGSGTLIALRAAGGGLAEAWRQPVDAHVLLAQDAESRHVVAFCNDAEQARWVWLQGEPADQLRPVPPLEAPPKLDPFQSCAWTPVELSRRRQAYMAIGPLLDLDDSIARVRALAAAQFDLVTGAALWFTGPPSQRALILERLRELHGRSPEVAMITAESLLHERRLEPALAALQELDPATPPELARHACHLRALCQLRLGRLAEARNELSRAPAGGADGCGLESLVQWIDALIAPPAELAEAAPRARADLVRRLRSADAALLRGDPDAARALLDHPVVWAFRDAQSIGRLAEAFLQSETQEPAMRVRQYFVLAQYCELLGRSPVLSLGPDDWSQELLLEIAKRARARLGEPEQPPPEAAAAAAGSQSRPHSRMFVTLMSGEGRMGTWLRDPESDQVLARHQADLVVEARDLLRIRPGQDLVGLVLDPSLPLAGHLRVAREQLRCTRGVGPEVAVVVSMQAANELLGGWPNLLDEFLAFDRVSAARGELSLLLVRRGGAGWRRAPL